MEKPSEPLDPDEHLEPEPPVLGNDEGIAPGAPAVGPRLELTWQAVLVAIIVSALVSASYPYVILKLGMGPNISVVSAFLGAALLMVLASKTIGRNRLMNNIVQTAGTSAGGTAFMCVVAAAVDLASQNPTMTDETMNGIRTIPPLPMFFWLFCAGGIGVLFTVLFRRHFLDDPKMIFADGVAAAETIVVLDSPGPDARDKFRTLGICTLLSALVAGVRDLVTRVFKWMEDDNTYFSAAGRSLGIGIEWSLLNLGTGILIGLNVCLSFLAGMLIVWVTGPMLIEAGIGKEIVLSNVTDENKAEAERLINKQWDELTKEEKTFVKEKGGKQAAYMNEHYFGILLLWYMWPATALMITAAITAVLLKWRTIVESFTKLQADAKAGKSEDVSMTTVVAGALVLTVLLALVQHYYFGMSYVQTVIAVLCSLPLILVGIRVLGETNNGPVSVMMNGLQAIFAVFWPAGIGHNLIAAGVAGSCNAQGQGTIQDYKTGKLVGSTPKVLTWAQLLAVPIGAAAVAIMYPVLTSMYKLGEDLATPTGVKIAGMAILLSKGVGALPAGALLWTVIGAVAGILSVLAVHYFKWEWMPSAAGIGFGMILPGTVNALIIVGGLISWFWLRYHKTSYERYAVTVASGLIAGEAILAGLILPVIRVLTER